MGSRSSTETITLLLKAFLDRRTWTQADLARHVGLSTPAVQKRLRELQESGIPLESERDHPHVYWSVPKTWYPGGVLLTSEQVTQILRQLSRLPQSKARNQLVATLLEYLPNTQVTTAVVAAESSAREEQHLPVIEDAAAQKVALRFSYFSASRGSEGSRHASVHRIVIGPPARFLATCHRTAQLKWFRVENMSDSRLDRAEHFREAAANDIDTHMHASLDGFHEGGPALEHKFFVRDPDARWVARNLMEEMRSEEVPGGICVRVTTSGLQRLARYVVGLGGAAKPLTPALEAAVVALAQGALAAIAAKASA